MVDVEMNGNAINILFIYLSIYLLLLFVYFLISHSEGWLDFSSKALIKDFGFLDLSKKKKKLYKRFFWAAVSSPLRFWLKSTTRAFPQGNNEMI